MSILDRIRAQGGEILRDEWRFSLRAGGLAQTAVDWLRDHWRDACREAWADFDRWEERAAIMEFDAGLTRAAANEAAYRGLSVC